jgi:uncharacterized protein YjbI with pentapeptide repeats
MATIQIKHRITGAVLFEHETTDERIASGLATRDALEAACETGANLAGANLAGANLDGAYLAGANLARANLARAYLAGANLDGANLDGAYLAGANLARANLARANLDGAYLASDRPVLNIGPIGSRNDYLTAYCTDKGVVVRTGCFTGTRDEFSAAVRKTHGDNKHAREYVAALALIDAHAAAWAPAVPAEEAA